MLRAYDRERQLMPILVENERQGVRTDVTGLRRDYKIYTGEREKADNWLRKELKVKDLNIDSDEEFANALDKNKIVTDWAYTKTGQRSTSKANLTPSSFKGARGAKFGRKLTDPYSIAVGMGPE